MKAKLLPLVSYHYQFVHVHVCHYIDFDALIAGFDHRDMGTGPYKDKGPWMVSIFTDPSCRGMVYHIDKISFITHSSFANVCLRYAQGVASRMLRAAMLQAKKVGLRDVLLWTDHEAALYARMGWKLV
jgi:GNAT superfamily N-acetyltransferase